MGFKETHFPLVLLMVLASLYVKGAVPQAKQNLNVIATGSDILAIGQSFRIHLTGSVEHFDLLRANFCQFRLERRVVLNSLWYSPLDDEVPVVDILGVAGNSGAIDEQILPLDILNLQIIDRLVRADDEDRKKSIPGTFNKKDVCCAGIIDFIDPLASEGAQLPNGSLGL